MILLVLLLLTIIHVSALTVIWIKWQHSRLVSLCIYLSLHDSTLHQK